MPFRGWCFSTHPEGQPSPALHCAGDWVLSFAIYALAEEIRASGVIAIVIVAVEMSSRASFTAEDRLSGHSFWEIVELVFTGLAFGLIGMSVREAIDDAGTMVWEAVVIGLALSVVAFAVRLHVRALSVLTFTMVIPGLLPWLVRQLNLNAGADAGGDKLAAELNERAYEAARRTVQEHSPKLAPESYFMVQEWLDALAERRHVGPEGSRERREAFERACAAAIEVQNLPWRLPPWSWSRPAASAGTTPRTSTPCLRSSTPWCSPPSATRSRLPAGLARAFAYRRSPHPTFPNAKQIRFRTPSGSISECRRCRSE